MQCADFLFGLRSVGNCADWRTLAGTRRPFSSSGEGRRVRVLIYLPGIRGKTPLSRNGASVFCHSSGPRYRGIRARSRPSYGVLGCSRGRKVASFLQLARRHCGVCHPGCGFRAAESRACAARIGCGRHFHHRCDRRARTWDDHRRPKCHVVDAGALCVFRNRCRGTPGIPSRPLIIMLYRFFVSGRRCQALALSVLAMVCAAPSRAQDPAAAKEKAPMEEVLIIGSRDVVSG